MSSSSKSKSKSASAEAFLSHERKEEILGLILIALSVLFGLAVLSYSPADHGIAESFSFQHALNPTDGHADNLLGHVGAVLAYLFVPSFLGYASLVLAALLGIWGYVFIRHKMVPGLPLVSLLTVLGAFLLACLIGWISHAAEVDLVRWAGEVGLGISGWMRQLFGAVGSLILLLVAGAVTTLMLIDHDVQHTLDRLESASRSFRNSFSIWWDELKERRSMRRAQQAEKRKERRKQQSGSKRTSGKAPSEETQEAAEKTPVSTDTSTSSTPSRQEPPPSYARVNDMYRKSDPPDDATARSTPNPDNAPEVVTKSEPVRSKAETSPSGASVRVASKSSDGPSLHVQEQIEEEKADDVTREADVPKKQRRYKPPSIDLLDEATEDETGIDYDELEENKQILLDKLSTYNVEIDEIKAIVGPTVTRYELLPASGVKISRIKSLQDDLAMAMAAKSIRVIAPIPGKRAVGVEIPNRKRELVRLRSVLGTKKFRDAEMELPVPIGKTIEGEVYLRDLSKMPHLLIAGATGSGKSVGLNALITGLIYACHPANLKFVIIDPKKIELQQYGMLENHFLAFPEGVDDTIITDFEQALGVLKSCEKEMEQRYDLLAQASVRGITDYNKKLRDGTLDPDDGFEHMPYIVVVVDELADLMMTAGKDIEAPIARLAQMARAVGIHLVLATQRPSVDVITGLIKANFPARMAYQVASRVDSRTILDQMGAEGLVGNGDLLYMSGSSLNRLQGPFVSLDEVERINGHVASQPHIGPFYLPSLEESGHGPTSMLGVEDTDELFEEAARVIVRRQQGSVSLLQRKLAVGYTRAARIVDQLEEAGIVGPFVGTKARDVLVEDLEQLEELFSDEEEDA